MQLRGKRCVVYDSDVRVRVRVRAAELSAYPDASVVCGQLERDSEDRDAVVNPVVIVEVLSPSTEDYDCGEKLDAYRLLDSVREIVLVAHDDTRIDVWRRGTAGWTVSSNYAGDLVRLDSLDATLAVDDVYADPFDGSG